jgi:hypothetical protein
MRAHRAMNAAGHAQGFRNRREQNEGRGTAMTGVYFIQCQGFIKIGHSIDVARRSYSIQNANPFYIEPLGFIRTATLADAKEMEMHLHTHAGFEVYRGEWFVDNAALRQVIAEHAQPWPIQWVDLASGDKVSRETVFGK